tara:strand:- start:1347 stop:2585 length:1239 start_codon:yes stop_codon:yes gene_type:complete
MNKPIAVIDLYCGMGGFTQGAIDAGATVILSVDFWDEVVEVHKLNHPDIPCLQMTLGTPSDWKLIKKFIDKYPNHHIHLHGSPPCQALSNASTTDPSKGMVLVLHFLDMVEKLNPDSWSMENVVPMRKRLPEGTPSVVLNSANFGVPQTRRRCIAGEGWVANPSHSKEEWISVIEALPHLEEELLTHLQGYSRTRPVMKNGKHTGVNTPRIPPDGCKTLDEPSFTVCSGSMNLFSINLDGATHSNSRRAISADVEITSPSLTLRNNRPTLRLVKLEVLGSNSKRERDRTITEPSKTICGSGNQVGARIFNHINLNTGGSTESIGAAAIAKDRTILKPSKVIRGHHVTLRDKENEQKPVKIRSLTVAETLILQGFNPDFDLSCTKTKKSCWTMVGNAVCPPVAKAIIEGIGNE